MLQTPYLNPGWTHTLCDFALHAIAVFMQLIAGNADVQTNCECGTSGFGKGIICLISGTPHDMMVDSAWTTKMFDAMLRSSPQCAARDLLTICKPCGCTSTVSICLSLWASVITLPTCDRCQMWQSEGSPKMQALWLHQHCVYLSVFMGVCDHPAYLRQVSDVAVRRLPQDASLVAAPALCLSV